MSDIKSIRFQFTKSPDYRIIAANGAWGGVAPNGMILADFFVEHLADPEATVRVLEEGKLGPESRIPAEAPERLVERQLQVGVALTPESARVIGEWLIQKADELATLAKAEQSESEI